MQTANLRSSDNTTISTLITAAHILAHHRVLDGFGHITARSPTEDSLFYYTGLPHALITSPDDFSLYRVSDGTPIDSSVYVSEYSEQFIHAAFYAAYPDVTSVVHSHARETLPFGILPPPSSPSNTNDVNTTSSTTHQPFRAVIHTAGFLGQTVPVWDAAAAYTQLTSQKRLPILHQHNLLVNAYPLGQSLASAAAISPDGNVPTRKHHKVVLQRGHGFTATGAKIEEAVYNAIYTVENALVLSAALTLRPSTAGRAEVVGLSEYEVGACTVMDFASIRKVWPLWVAEVERSAFYRKEGSRDG